MYIRGIIGFGHHTISHKGGETDIEAGRISDYVPIHEERRESAAECRNVDADVVQRDVVVAKGREQILINVRRCPIIFIKYNHNE